LSQKIRKPKTNLFGNMKHVFKGLNIQADVGGELLGRLKVAGPQQMVDDQTVNSLPFEKVTSHLI
jgi:hypothetical protein